MISEYNSTAYRDNNSIVFLNYDRHLIMVVKNMIIASIKNMHYKLGNKKILEEINWTINQGEHWIVLGNNGSGKTTLASILAGYHGYSEGELCLFGHKATKENIQQLRTDIGFVSDSYFSKCIFKENGFNIILGGDCGQLCENDYITDNKLKKAIKLLKAFGIKDKGMYPFDMLSKGQQQKVLLCRAFMKKTQLLVLDEPCTGLDLISREFLLNTLQKIADEGKTNIVCVTHHLDEILPFYTHVLLLKDGQVFLQGEIKNVITEENMTNFFGKATSVQWLDKNIKIRIKEELVLPEALWKNEVI